MAGQSSGRSEASALVFVDALGSSRELTRSYPSSGNEPNGNRDESKEDHPEQPEHVDRFPSAPVPLVQRDQIEDRQQRQYEGKDYQYAALSAIPAPVQYEHE